MKKYSKFPYLIGRIGVNQLHIEDNAIVLFPYLIGRIGVPKRISFPS